MLIEMSGAGLILAIIASIVFSLFKKESMEQTGHRIFFAVGVLVLYVVVEQILDRYNPFL